MSLRRASVPEAPYQIIFLSPTSFTGPGGNGKMVIKKL